MLSWVYTPDKVPREEVRFAQDQEYWELQIQLEDLSQPCPKEWFYIRVLGELKDPPVVAGSYLFKARYTVPRYGQS